MQIQACVATEAGLLTWRLCCLPGSFLFQSPKPPRDHVCALNLSYKAANTTGYLNLQCKHGTSQQQWWHQYSLCDGGWPMCIRNTGINELNCHIILLHRCKYYLWVKKLRPREVKQLAQSHPASKWQSQALIFAQDFRITNCFPLSSQQCELGIKCYIFTPKNAKV